MSQSATIARLNAALEGRYRIKSELGEGGMARVYLADDVRQHRRVAVKVLKPELAEKVAAERFLEEIRTTANLQHPHVLPLFDSGEADGFLFFVMPFIEGESLDVRLKRDGRLPIAEAVRITALIAGALQYAHGQGVIHRDVKPANVMMSGDLPVLADFGISLALRQARDVRLTETGSSVGSALYGSPEQLSGDEIDARADQYSLGCVLYELLVGEPPHAAASMMAILAKRLTTPSTPVRELRDAVPEHVERALARALEMQPGDRFEEVRAFADALADGRSVDAPAHLRAIGNLPRPATSLLGREDALDDVVALLDSKRLVTLLGMGGLGKTRLAVETAARAAANFPDGTWFVDLAAVTDAQAVGHAAAGVFGVTQQAGKTLEQSVVEALAGRRLLLILDNCEHVTGAAAALADALLETCPEIRIVATSREVLSIDGEHVWPVTPLGTDGADTSAVELFVERARAVAPSFALGDQGPIVAEICAELDGIPLAIELAAARVRSLSPRQILDRLGERFRLLTGGSRAPDRQRHQTLRRAVQWSYDLLSDEERAVLNRASVFSGGFTLEATEQVCAGDGVDEFDVVDLLDSLVTKSLLSVSRSDETVRYAALQTIRSFGAEQLEEAGEADAVRRRHGEFFARQSGGVFELWRSPREPEAYEWLDREINNLRDAFHWARENGVVDVAARIASDVGDIGRFRLREEAATWAEEIVEAAREVNHPRLAVLLTWSSSSAWAFGRFDDARRFGEAALALKDDPTYDPFIWAFGDLAFVCLLTGDVEGGLALIREGAEHPTDERDRFILAFCLYLLAITGNGAEALAMMDDALAKVDATGIPASIAVAYGGKGAALEGSDSEAALAAYEHSIRVSRGAGNRFLEMLIAPRIAALQARSGDPAEALEAFERMLVTFGEATDMATLSAWRASLAVLLAKLGHHTAAATLTGSFVSMVDASSVVPEHPEAMAGVRAALGEEAYAQAEARGGAMSLREASNYAIEQVRLGRASITESTSD